MIRHTKLASLVALTALSASAAIFPDAGAWQPVAINSADGGTVYLGDPLGDGQNNGRDIVGDDTRPAFYISSSATHFFFRLRLNTDPSGPGGLASYGWGILIDVDGEVRDYDYVLMADGIDESIKFSRKSTKTLAGDPSELADVLLDSTPMTYTGAAQNVALSAVGAGTSGFGGNEDYFLDMAVPLSTLYGTNPDGGAYLNFSPSTVLRFWVGISNSSRSITLDIGGTGTSPGPGTLPGTVSAPQLLCQTDSTCGSATSGKVCSSGTCVSGCRGTGGNSCPAGSSCSSSTSSIGTCLSAGAPPVISTPANGSVTSNKQPVISGASAANATINVSIDGVLVGTTTANAAGAWSYTPAILADGVHTTSATATVTGLTSASSNLITFTVDSAPPAAPVIAAPANGSTTSDNTPVLSGTAEPQSTVRVFIDGAQVGTTTASAAGTWTFEAPVSLMDGSHTVRATASDAAGNTSAGSNTNTFTVDTAAPAAPLVAVPANGALTNDGTPTVMGSAEPNSTVRVFIDGVQVGTVTADLAGSWSFTTASLSDGPHTVRATATDAVGNTSASSATHSFIVDTAAPGAPIVSTPAHGSTSGNSSPEFSGTAVAGSVVTIVVDGSVIGTTTASASGAWSLPAPFTLTDGPHTVGATSTDAAGNVSTASSTNSFSVDTAAPLAPVVSLPANGAQLANRTPTVSGNAEPFSTVTVFIDGNAVGTTTTSAGGAWSFSVPASLADGTHTARATATDVSGNTSASSNTNTFSLDATAPTAPVVTAPTDGSITANRQPSITGTAEAGSTVTVIIDGVAAGTAIASSSGAWSFTPVALSDGSHTVNATSTDESGNASLSSNSSSFEVDTNAPAAPVVSAPAHGSTTTDQTPTISGTSEAPNLTITVRIDGVVAGVAISGMNGAWSLTAGPLALGSHSVSATATDAAANVSASSSSNDFTILPFAPGAPLLNAPVDGVVLSDGRPTFTGTAEPGSTVTVRVDGEVVCTATASTQGAFSCTPAQSIPEGNHVATVSASNAGGSSPEGSVTSFEIDTTAPLTPFVVGPAPGSVTADTTPAISGTGEPGSLIAISIDGQPAGEVSVRPDGTWSFVPAIALALGAHQVSARAIDEAGNLSLPSNTNGFSVVSPSPGRPTLDSPADNAALSAGQPTFGGTAAPGATVTVLVDGQAACTATAASDGSWSCSSAQALAPGLHRAVAETTGGTSETRSFTFDPVAPLAPIVTGPVDGSSTTDATPSIEGTAEALSVVNVFVDGVLLGSTNADVNGRWVMESPALTLGSHIVTATATDRAGNVSPTSLPNQFTVVAPNGAPVVLGPQAGATTSDSTPMVSGTGSPGATIEVTIDGAIVCTASATASGAWSCVPTAALADGRHVVDAREQGSGLTSTPVPFTVDTVAPAAPAVTAPTANAYSSPTPTLAGTAEPGVRVEVSVDGMPVCVTLADAQGQWSCVPSSPLVDGTHSVTAQATDVATNESLPSQPVSFQVDRTPPPAPVLSAPLDGSTLTDPTPTFSGSAEPGSTVTVRVDGMAVCTAVADSLGAFSCASMSALPRGAHTATATTIDRAGNLSPTSNQAAFTIVAETPPAPAISGPVPGTLTADSTPRITGTATPGSTVTVRDARTLEVLCSAVADAMGNWSCDSRLLADGEHGLVATAEKDGALSNPSSQTTIRVDTTPPRATVEGTPTAPITSATNTTFIWITEPGTIYECSLDGGAFQECTAPFDVAGLTPGQHSLTVRATDGAGNSSETTTTWLVEDRGLPGLHVEGGGLSCAAVPSQSLALLALLLLALRRRRAWFD